MSTVYEIEKALTAANLFAIYEDSYKDTPFVRVQDDLPELHNDWAKFYRYRFSYNMTNVLTIVSLLIPD